MINEQGVQPNPKYLAIVKDWPLPTTIKELRTFLGKVSYYRRFIEGYSGISCPLYSLLGKDADQDPKALKLGEKEITAFKKLREALCAAPILAYPDFQSDKMFILDTDWSNEAGAIGAVLSQEQDGEERVICYGGQKLTKTQKNYSSNKGELFAVITFMKQWKYYLQCRPFILRTDHRALQWIRTMEEPQGMILRWLETLSNHNFIVQFRDGKKHGNADALSRCGHGDVPPATDEYEQEEAIYHIRPKMSTKNNVSELGDLIRKHYVS